MTLTEFLLDRIAEDEVVAADVARRQAVEIESSTLWPYEDFDLLLLTIEPTRVLAECETKRRIIQQLREVSESELQDEGVAGIRSGLEYALASLAAVYADHPDFDPAWKVEQ